MKRGLNIMTLFCLSAASKAQQRPEGGIWLTLNAPINFSKHWQWYNDASYRTMGISPDAIQYYYRTAMRYNFNQQWSTAGGIAFFFTKTDFDKTHHEFGHEFRFWEEINQLHMINEKSQWLLRFRAEQRFFAATSIRDKFTGYRFRLRPGFNQKLNDKWSIQLTDEYMQQWAHEKFSFDQNRLTFSGIYKFNNSTQLHGGYLWLVWPSSDQHILTFTFTKIISLYEH